MRRLTQIPFPARALDASAAPDVVLGMVEVVNALLAQLWLPEELPEPVVPLYYADFYVAQVLNGGHSQFLYNAGDSDRIATLARGGLMTVGATTELAILDRALALSRAKPTLLERLKRWSYWGAAAQVAPAFEAEDRGIALASDAPDGWSERCAAWLRASPVLNALDEPSFERAMADLRAAVPDHAARIAAREAAKEAAMSPFERAIRQACRDRGRAFEGIRMGRPLEDGTTQWAFAADGARHRAIARGDQLVRIEWDIPLTAHERAMLAKLAELRGNSERGE